jgi:hypothetical protein
MENWPRAFALLPLLLLLLSLAATADGVDGELQPQQLPDTVVVYLCVTGRELSAGTTNSIFTLLEVARPLRPKVHIFPDVRSSSDLVQLRSAVLTEWYDKADDNDVFVFVDNDIVFTPDDFFHLLTCKADVCGGLYSGGDGDQGTPRASWLDVDRWLAGETEEVLFVGAGFTAIHRPVLTKIISYMRKQDGFARVSGLSKRVVPFFQEVITRRPVAANLEQQELVWMGEDVSFCYRVRMAGGVVKAFYSPTIGHLKTKQFVLGRSWEPKKPSSPQEQEKEEL